MARICDLKYVSRNFDLLVKGEMHNLEIYSAGLCFKEIKCGNLIYTGVGEARGM
jgi:hypothetical protein